MTSSEPLELAVSIDASPDTVFHTLVDPASFAEWMGAAMGKATIDPRVGGDVTVTFPHGLVVRGEVLELSPPTRLVLSWGVEGGDPFPPGATRVEFTVEPHGPGGARLRLRHHGLPDDKQRRDHRGGWNLYLSVLAARAAKTQHGDKLASVVGDWFAAWRESDASARANVLARCTSETVAFRHAYAALTGRTDLSQHIAASQQHMAGMQLEADGEPALCHGWVRFPWKVVKDGQVVSRGTNVGRLSEDSTFELVVGF